ncbi:TPA: L-lactate permease [Shigella flexneri]|nr:L-lactate permease [Shigella flexneri]
MNLWQQNYDPAGNIWLSSLIASLPILFFFFALIKLKLKGYVAASWTVAIALAVALLFYKMPVANALASVVYGFFYGLWPIAWIIIAAVFVYKISVKTGQFDIIRSSILSITPDQRLQMLIVGFCFGAFLEGAAGFGAPVAITAALLVGLGFKPLYAAGLCLIVNTAPVAFGAMGIPILVAGQVTGIDSFEIGQMVGRQLPFMTIIVLFWIMAIMDGWRGIKETWPAVVVAGGSFAIAQYLSSNFIGPELPDIISSLVSLLCLTLFLKRWQPVRVFRFGDLGASQVDMTLAHTGYTAGQVLRAWTPFLFLTATVTLWSIPPFKALFAALQATAAQQIGVSDLLLVAANTTGGVTGKMISPQSIAIACAAVGLVGKESDLFRFTVKHSLIFTCMVGVITTLQAYVLTWMIP